MEFEQVFGFFDDVGGYGFGVCQCEGLVLIGGFQ